MGCSYFVPRAALAALFCFGPLSACSSDDDNPASFVPTVLVGEGDARVGTVADGSFDADGPDLGLSDADLGMDSAVDDADAGSSEDVDPPDASDPCAIEAQFALPAEQAVLRQEELDGTFLRVMGTAVSGPPSCSQDPCDDGSECCNTCFAPISVESLVLTGYLPCTETATVGCQGGACDPPVCQPPAFGIPGGFEGFLRAGSPPRLEIIRFSP